MACHFRTPEPTGLENLWGENHRSLHYAPFGAPVGMTILLYAHELDREILPLP